MRKNGGRGQQQEQEQEPANGEMWLMQLAQQPAENDEMHFNGGVTLCCYVE